MDRAEALYNAVKSGKVDINRLSPQHLQELREYRQAQQTPTAKVEKLATNRQDSLKKQFDPFIKQAPKTEGPMLTQGKQESSFKDKALQFGKGIANGLGLLPALNTVMDRSLQNSAPGRNISQIESLITKEKPGKKVDPFFQKQFDADKKRSEEKLKPKTTGEKIASGAGELVGSLAPITGAYATGGKLAVAAGKRILPNLVAKELGKQAVRGAGAGLVYGAGKGIVEGGNAEEIAKEAGINALMFGVGDPALSALGGVAKRRLIEPLVNKFGKAKTLTPEVIPETKILETEPISLQGKQPELPRAEKPIGITAEPIGIKPKQTALEYQIGPNERQFAQNVMDSQIATGEIKQNLVDNKLTYEPITNKETFDKATNDVKNDPEGALEMFNSPSKGVSADDVALGEALITKAIKEGNPQEANRLIADLAEKLTTAGQAVQAASIFKRLSPEGMLLYAQRMINSANKELILRKGAKAKKILLTGEDADFIINTMKEAQLLPDGRPKDIAIAKVMQLITDKTPATLSEKVKGLQRISLLLNPKTMVRNTLGNTIFGVVDNISNAVATPIDFAVGKLTKKRTTTLPNPIGQLKSGWQGAKETIEDAKLGIDTASSSTQFELPNKRIFETKVLNKLDQATKVGLQLGDRPFYKAAYDDVLRQQMKLAKVTEPTQAMIEQAHKIAQQRTYQDTNALTEAFKAIQKGMNKVSNFVGLSSKEFGLGNIVLPFVKTPANILARAIEYSPLGVTKALKEATKMGSGLFDQKTFVDAIARSVTGSALIMVGYDLAKRGMITGSGNKDKDVAAFERNLGKSDFAFKVNDKYYTYDWAQPASMALAIGADIQIKGKDRKDAENVVSDAIISGGETLFKQSLLQGVQRFMGGFSPMENIETTAINAPTQFIPTLSKQITQLTDPIQRNSFSQSKVGTGLNLIKAKTPGLSKTLEPKVDTFGKEVKNFQGKNNLFNVFVNPGNTTEFKPNNAQKEIIRVFESTGNKEIFPKVAPNSFTEKKVKYELTPKEKTTFQKTMGKKTEEKTERLVNSKQPDKVKAKIMKKMIEDSYEAAKLELLRSRKK